jgi:hypothetical protein
MTLGVSPCPYLFDDSEIRAGQTVRSLAVLHHVRLRKKFVDILKLIHSIDCQTVSRTVFHRDLVSQTLYTLQYEQANFGNKAVAAQDAKPLRF